MKYEVNGINVNTVEDEALAAGAVKVHFAEFTFDATWDEYTSKVAVFKRGSEERESELENGKCEIPWEILIERGVMLVGVYGATSEKRRPTLWASPKVIEPGAQSCEKSRDPSPDKWQHVLKTIERLTYNVTPHIGENGNWYVGDTDTGVKARGDDGDDYILTAADKVEVVDSVLAALPDGDEVSY